MAKLNQLIVKEATRFIQDGSSILQVHELAYILYELTKIRKSGDSFNIAQKYLGLLIQSNPHLFTLEDTIFLAQSLTNSTGQPS